MPKAYEFNTIPKKILLPIDFSPSAHEALERAIELAQHFGAELHLVNVLPTYPSAAVPGLISEEEFAAAARAHAEKQFAAAHADLSARDIKVTSSIEAGEDEAEAIAETIEREHIDMVLVSTHGNSGWHPLIFGAIAEKLIRLAQCPVLLLHSRKPASGIKTGSSRSMEWW